MGIFGSSSLHMLLENLYWKVDNYVKLKGLITECKQARFQQKPCELCKQREKGCKLYSHYVDAWIKMQEAKKKVERQKEVEKKSK